MTPPIFTPDGTEVEEVILPDGSEASEVIAPDGTVVFEGIEIPDSELYRYEFDEPTGQNIIENKANDFGDISLNFDKENDDFVAFDGNNDYGTIDASELDSLAETFDTAHAVSAEIRSPSDGFLFGAWDSGNDPIYHLFNGQFRHRNDGDPFEWTYDGFHDSGDWFWVIFSSDEPLSDNWEIEGIDSPVWEGDGSTAVDSWFGRDLAVGARNNQGDIDNHMQVDMRTLQFHDAHIL